MNPSTHRLSEVSTRPLAAWCLLASLIAAALWMRWPGPEWLATDFQSLLPVTTTDTWQQQASTQSAQAFERQLVLMAEGPAAGEFLGGAVKRLESAGYVDTQLEASQALRWRALAQVLQPFRSGLLTDKDYSSLAQDPAAYLATFRSALYSPLGGQWLANLPQDPLGLFHNFLRSNLETSALPAEKPELAFIQLPKHRTNFRALEGLYSIHTALRDEAKSKNISYSAFGSPLYNAFGVESGRKEISTVGAVSIAALTALLFLVLRSAAGFLATGVSVGAGLIGGFAITLACFQQIHIIALVFGSSLLGIAADYAFHYLCHSMLPGWTPQEALGKVRRGLSLSVGSTALAFLTLTLIPFPGLQQIGLFMAAGLLCSFTTVCLLFPLLYRKGRPGTLAVGTRTTIIRHRLQATPLALILAVLSIPGILQLSPRDEVRDFFAAPEDLEQDRLSISSSIGQSGDSSYLLFKASDEERLLQLEETVVSQVATLHPCVTVYVPSIAKQQRNRALLEQLLAQGVIQRHMESLGIEANSIKNYTHTISDSNQSIRLADLEGLELPIGRGGFLGCDAKSCASWISVSGQESAQELTLALKQYSGVTLVQPVADINKLIAKYRLWSIGFLFVAALVAGLILTLLLGTFMTVRVLLLPVGACTLSLALLGYLNGGYTIVNVLALFIVGGMALDFGIFLHLSAATSRPAVHLAIALSALSTLLAFGTLSLSSTPVIAGFGFSIGSGLLLAWLLSLIIVTPPAPTAEK